MNSNSGSYKNRPRRSKNRQRHSDEDDDVDGSESTTKTVRVKSAEPEIAESEPKVIDKRQSGSGHDEYRDYHRGQHGHNPHQEFNDPYDARTGSYQHPTGYEGPPLSSSDDESSPGRGGGYHGGRGGGGGGGGYRGGNDGYGGSDFEFGPPTSGFRSGRGSTSASPEFDFSIPREFDPDVQLGPQGGYSGGGRGGGGGGGYHQQTQDSNRRSGPQVSASSRRDTTGLDDFDIGYNDYVRQNFPESLRTPAEFTNPRYETSDSDYEFKPNYYHRKSAI